MVFQFNFAYQPETKLVDVTTFASQIGSKGMLSCNFLSKWIYTVAFLNETLDF